jgi:tetratricopeptide (TPR) repeat protein
MGRVRSQIRVASVGVWVLGVLPVPVSMLAAEQAWEVQGDLVEVKPGEPAVAVLAMPGGQRFEVPLSAFSPASRDTITAQVGARVGARQADVPEGGGRDEATKMVEHALELLRLGNLKLAEAQLVEASRVNPQAGTADFVLGLAYALINGHEARAIDAFVRASQRQPRDAYSLNNLAVVEVFAKRYASAVEHFRQAIERSPDNQHIAANIAWAIRRSANPRHRIPDRALSDLNALYRQATQDLGVKPAESTTEYVLLNPRGEPCRATTAAELADAISERQDTAASGEADGTGQL